MCMLLLPVRLLRATACKRAMELLPPRSLRCLAQSPLHARLSRQERQRRRGTELKSATKLREPRAPSRDGGEPVSRFQSLNWAPAALLMLTAQEAWRRQRKVHVEPAAVSSTASSATPAAGHLTGALLSPWAPLKGPMEAARWCMVASSGSHAAVQRVVAAGRRTGLRQQRRRRAPASPLRATRRQLEALWRVATCCVAGSRRPAGEPGRHQGRADPVPCKANTAPESCKRTDRRFPCLCHRPATA